MQFVRSFVRKLLLGLGILVLASCCLAAANVLIHRHSIDRTALGITAEQAGAVCPKTIPHFYKKYVPEVMANDHLLYAIASNEAYGDPALKFFLVEKYDKNFSKFDTGDRGGVRYTAYIKRSGTPTVLVAFRGTRATNWRDWFANFSWITGALPIENEYAIARDAFRSVREKALAELNGVPVSFVVTGHSLGGGLAQHVAAGFPCVDAVVFDASFVTNVFEYVSPFETSVTIHIYDTGDELTRLRSYLFTQKDSPTYRWYPTTLSPCKESSADEKRPRPLCHAITPFTIGMAGTVLDCQIRRTAECGIPSSDTRAQDVYCPSDGIRDEVCLPALARLGIH